MASGVEKTIASVVESSDVGTAAPMEEDDQNPTSPSSSSSSDDEPLLDEAEEDREIETLDKLLASEPLNYEAHIQYIQCLRKFGRITKLRQARETMNERFPLSPNLWQQWIKDEVSLCNTSEAFAEIEKLYERGIEEYFSVPLWSDYLNFVQEHDESVSQCSAAGISKMRKLFERALTAAGLHMTEGNKIWEAYIEFEQAILLTMGDNKEEKAKQVHRVRALCNRQLSVPLFDLSSKLRDYKLWEADQGNGNDIDSEFDGVPPGVVSSYKKAVEACNLRKDYEDQISKYDSSDTERLQQYMNYIKFEESSGDPARVQVLYERAILEFPISSDLWLGYTSYLDRTLKVPSILKSVFLRATRNCTWIGELWVRRLLSMERIHASEKELSEIFEQSIHCPFSSYKEYLDLFLTRVDGLRRRMTSVGHKEEGLAYVLIRDTFQRAVDYLSPEVLNLDDLLSLHSYWAHLESSLGKDLLAARGVWESLIKKSGMMIGVWQGYISMEIELRQYNEARAIYKRCYSKRFSGTGSEDICHSWLRFEREYGTLDDYDLAMKKVSPRLQELMIFKSQQESQIEPTLSAKRDGPGAVSTRHKPEKRKLGKMVDDKHSASKRKKHDPIESVVAAEQNLIKKSEKSDDAGEVEKVHIGGQTKAVDTASNKDQPLVSSKDEESKPRHYNDECTAFISNISLEAKEEHLRDFFSDIGGVTAIRLLRDRGTGKSRGLAYVDFSDEKHLDSAIAKNKHKFLGKKVCIARSDPKQKRESSGANTSRGGGRTLNSGVRRERADLSDTRERNRNDRSEKFKGNVTFAAPRSVIRPLGRTREELLTDPDSEKPKSNDEFRDMLLKK